jgi:hypothetical protein
MATPRKKRGRGRSDVPATETTRIVSPEVGAPEFSGAHTDAPATGHAGAGEQRSDEHSGDRPTVERPLQADRPSREGRPHQEDSPRPEGRPSPEDWPQQARPPREDAPGETTRVAPERERIARRAYELYQARGGEAGRDMDDWLKAEREILSARRRDSEEG